MCCSQSVLDLKIYMSHFFFHILYSCRQRCQPKSALRIRFTYLVDDLRFSCLRDVSAVHLYRFRSCHSDEGNLMYRVKGRRHHQWYAAMGHEGRRFPQLMRLSRYMR